MALNSEVTRLTGKKPVDTTKDKSVYAKSSTNYSRPVDLKETRFDSSMNVRYLYAADEMEGGQRRATGPIWSLKVCGIEKSIVNKGEPVFYSLKDGPKRGFVREELSFLLKEFRSQSCQSN